MYHYLLRIVTFGLNAEQTNIIRQIQPLEGFDHEIITDPDNAVEVLSKGNLVIWNKDFSSESIEKIIAALAPFGKLIVCADANKIGSADKWLEKIFALWPEKMSLPVFKALLEKALETIKLSDDKKLTENYLNSLIDNMPDMVWFKDVKGAHLKVNEAFCRVVGKTKEDIKGRGHCYIWNLDPKEYADGEYICMESELPVINEAKSFMFEEKVKYGNRMHYLNTYKAPIFDVFHNVIGTVGYARDMTAIWDDAVEMRIVLDNFPFAILLFDEKNKIKIANDFFCTLFNLAKEKVEGLTEEKFKLLIKDKVRVLSIKQDKKKEKKYIEISVGNGIKHILLITERSLDIAAGTVTGKIVGYEDVTKEYQATVDSYNLAITDPLTGTYNRRHQRDVVAELINKGKPFVLGAIDLDNLKQVNDNYGHATGDLFIKSSIKFLLKNLSSDDVVCRVGGDEFVVAFVGKTKANCEKILAQTNAELENAGFVFPASLSYGVVSLDKITFSAYRKALKEADVALYDMKKNKKIVR